MAAIVENSSNSLDPNHSGGAVGDIPNDGTGKPMHGLTCDDLIVKNATLMMYSRRCEARSLAGALQRSPQKALF